MSHSSKEKLLKIIEPIQPYLDDVDRYIEKTLDTEIDLLRSVQDHIFNANGKRIRPVLHILSGLSLGDVTQKNIIVASTTEFIHTATLLHDDVIDNSSVRRGKPTVNHLWGNELSVMVGDFFYTQSINSLLEIKNTAVLKLFSNATQRMAEGEIIQHQNLKNINITEQKYFEIIFRKTAILFSACCQSAAILSGLKSKQVQQWAHFGEKIGLAFQLVDDLLDYTGEEKVLGKPKFNDLHENKITMPLLHAILNVTDPERTRLGAILRSDRKNEQDIEFVMDCIRTSGGLKQTLELATTFQQGALDHLHDFKHSPYFPSLEVISNYIIDRTQ